MSALTLAAAKASNPDALIDVVSAALMPARPMTEKTPTVDAIDPPELATDSSRELSVPSLGEAHTPGGWRSQGTPQPFAAMSLRILGRSASTRATVGGPDSSGDACCVWCGVPVHPQARTCRDYHRARLAKVRRELRAAAGGSEAACLWLETLPEHFVRQVGGALARRLILSGCPAPHHVAGALLLSDDHPIGLLSLLDSAGLVHLLAVLGR